MNYDIERVSDTPKQLIREPTMKRLQREKAGLEGALKHVNKQIALLEEHPEFEQFMDTFGQ